MEGPRREGSVYSEEYGPAGAREIAASLARGDREEASRLARAQGRVAATAQAAVVVAANPGRLASIVSSVAVSEIRK